MRSLAAYRLLRTPRGFGSVNRDASGSVCKDVPTLLTRPGATATVSPRPGTARAAIIDASRGLAAAGVLLSAVVHLDLYDVQLFREIHIIGPLFLLNVIAGLALGVLVLVWRHWLPALLCAGFGMATVTAFWITVVHGMFGFKEVATGDSQVLAEISEYVAAVFGLVAAVLLWREWRANRR